MKIAIYRIIENEESDDHNKITRVHFLPADKSNKEIHEKIVEYNKSQERYQATSADVPDYLEDVFEFIIKNRTIDVNRHIDALSDIKDKISDIDDYLYSVVRELKEKISKKKE